MVLPFNQRPWTDDLEQPDQEDLSSCPECWSTESCDACMATAEAEWTKALPEVIPFPDHDRRFSDHYDTANGDIGDEVFDFDNPPF